MTHIVTGLIAKPFALEAFASKHSLHSPISLSVGLSILPLRDDDIDSLLPSPPTGLVDGFEHLSEQLMHLLEAASLNCALLYFETEYFGGDGSQGAVVFCNGVVAYGPKCAGIGPISEALRLLGVTVIPPAFDEFETIGLRRYRQTKDWLESGDG